MPIRVPALRRKLNRKRQPVGVVTLTDYQLHHRRDFYCGDWDTPECRQRYAELIGQWEIAGRRWPGRLKIIGVTVAEIVQRYWRWAQTYYSKGGADTIKAAWRVLVAQAGELPAADFGPIKLRTVRQAMIGVGWNRTFINQQIHRVAAIFKWAAGNELLPIAAYQALKAIEPLKRGRCTAPEPKPVRPVAAEHVDAIRPWVSRQVWAMVELQRLTGARPGELVALRPLDIDRSGDVWRAELTEHKTLHRGKVRALNFGPLAQQALVEFLLRPDDAFLFSPREAENERIVAATQARVTDAKTGHRATGRRRKDVGDCYSVSSYRRAITRACDQANRWVKGGRICADADRLIPRWHPHQLRHTAATGIRRQFGLEAASTVLGHSSARITDAVYAERDQGIVEDVMRRIG